MRDGRRLLRTVSVTLPWFWRLSSHFYTFGSLQFQEVFDSAVAIVDPSFEAGEEAHSEAADTHS